MADTVLTNTYLPAGPGGTTLERESLRDVVEMVAVDQTPLYSNIEKVAAGAIKEEWATEDIGSITAAPARNRGFVASIQAPVANRRLDNYLELNAVEFGVSDSMNKMPRVAGNTNTLAHQRLKWGIKLRRQINKLLFTPQIKSGTEPTTMATLPAYITNFKSVAGTPGVAPTGNGTNIPTAGSTPADLTTITPFDDVMEVSVFTKGTPSVVYFSPRRKRQFSKVPDANIGTYTQNQPAGNPKPWTFIGTVDLYLSDFGTLEFVVDDDADNTFVMLLNHDFIDMPILPGMDFDEQELGRRGSGREMLIQHEATIRITLPEACALINGYKS